MSRVSSAERGRFHLPDGRWLGVRQVGDPAGIPVLYWLAELQR